MTDEQDATSSEPVQSVSNNVSNKTGWRTFGIIVITMAVTLAVGYWLVTAYLFPNQFTPVQLSQTEQQRLDQKLKHLGVNSGSSTKSTLEPEAYSEAGANREIHLSEKELNSLLAKNTDLASRLVIDLSDNLASAKLLIHLDPDFPLLGGNTVKVTAGMALSLSSGKPIAILKGVSVWGVPLPNAWLGNMKNTNLIEEFGQAGGFWHAINDGVETIEVKEGTLRIKLKE
jgi:hypothetical protein